MKTGKILSRAVDMLYPKRCPFCDGAITADRLVCGKCSPKVKYITGSTCFKCGKPLQDDGRMYCYDCRIYPKSFDRGFAVFEYDSVRESLYRFKYSGRAEYADFYAASTVKLYSETFHYMKPQAFVPIPVHKSRYNSRGYNQAEEYALSLSKLTGIPVESKLIKRVKRTKAQKELTPLKRQKNLKKAFKLCSYGVKLQRVCVVDDIYTTGSTINAVAELLLQAGVREVYFIAIAVGRGF